MADFEMKINMALFNEKLFEVLDEEPFTVAYGYIEEKEGWHLITADYPSYIIHHMGENYEEALKFVNDLVAEIERDMNE